jgi:hypothetical protein
MLPVITIMLRRSAVPAGVLVGNRGERIQWMAITSPPVPLPISRPLIDSIALTWGEINPLPVRNRCSEHHPGISHYRPPSRRHSAADHHIANLRSSIAAMQARSDTGTVVDALCRHAAPDPPATGVF